MSKLTHILFILITATIFATSNVSCIDDDFYTDSSHILTFSTDTLRFDTIFTDVGTPTSRFMVYNRGKKSVNISSINVVSNSADARFNINVDGINASSFNDVEIRGGDSIYVLVEAYIQPTGNNTPQELTGRIEFITNGVNQSVILSAWGQDVERLYSPTINSDSVLSADKPYILFDTLTVAQGATLTLEPGATIYCHDKAAIIVNGTLRALGTQEKNITIRGDRTDKVVGGIAFDIMSGQWGGINFTATSYDNEIQYTDIHSSTTGITADSCDINTHKLHILNSVIHNSSTTILSMRHCHIEAEGTEFSEAANNIFYAEGGYIRMINCTFANQYLFSVVSGSIIYLSHVKNDNESSDTPIMDARFDNCIVHGNASDINIGDLTDTNVMFRSTMFKSAGDDDDNFINCTWDGDPKFYTVRLDYYFDYRIKNESAAIGIGNREYVPDYALNDRYGNPRVRTQSDGTTAIDAGAYVWIPEDEETK